MSEGLPVSRLVNVGVVLSPALAQAINFQSCLVVGSSDVIDVVTRMKEYESPTEVATDFGTSAPEYYAAQAWFGQLPQPTSLLIGRWADADTPGQLFGGPLSAAEQVIGNWTAINNGAFKIAINGVGPTEYSGLNFNACANLNAVAAVIESAFPGGTATCVWDAINSRFVIESVLTGDTAAISFMTSPDIGTDISGLLKMTETSSGAYVADGIEAETALEAVVIMDNKFSSQWYGLVVLGADDTSQIEVAEYIQASTVKHFFAVTTQDTGVISAASTTDLAYLMKESGTDTLVQYSSTSGYAAVSALARILTTNWDGSNTAMSLMYKIEPGITPEDLTLSQITALESKNCNVFVKYNNGTSIIEKGICSSGQFVDTVIGIDWLAAYIQNNVFNVLYTSGTKIPQTDAGNNILATSIEKSCDQALRNGLLGPGYWNSQGFGTLTPGQYLPKGFYVYAPPISTQSPADRAARKSVPFQVAAKLAGAINTVDVTINVNT